MRIEVLLYIYIMKQKLRFSILLIVLSCFISNGIIAQKMVLVKHKYRPVTIKLKKGNNIRIKTKDSEVYGPITFISMSSIVLSDQFEFELKDIKSISVIRSLYYQLSKALPIAGIAYVGLDATNRAINDEKPVFEESTLTIGASLFMSQVVFRPLSFKKMKIGKKWKVEIIDFDL